VEGTRRARTWDGLESCTTEVEYFYVPLAAEMAAEYGLGEGSRLVLIDTPGLTMCDGVTQELAVLRRIAIGLSHS